MANKHLRDVIQELENIIANSNAPVSSRVMQTLQRLKHASNVSLQSSAQTLISNGDIQSIGDQLISAATALPNENDLARIDSERTILEALHNHLMGHLSQGRTIKAPKTMDLYNRLVKREMRAGVTTADYTATPSASGYSRDARYNKNNVQARTAAQANTFAYKRQRAVLAALKRYTPGTPQYKMIAEAAGQDIRKGINDRKISNFQNTTKTAFKAGKLDLNYFKKDKANNFDEIRETYGNMQSLANVYGSRARGASQHQTHLKMLRDLQDFQKQFGDVLSASNKQSYVNSFQQQQQNSKKKKERNDFINQILTGIKQIFGKNALGDMIKWLILLFGKNHPVLASILLTLPTVIGTFKALSNVIRGLIGTIRSIGGVLGKIFTALSIFAAGGTGALAMMIGGSKGGLVRKVVLGASKLSKGNSALFGANSFIGKNILTPFRNMALRTSAFKGAIGLGGKNLWQVGKGALGSIGKVGGKLLGPLSGLVSFGINKGINGQSTGEAATRAITSTILGSVGAAFGGVPGAMLGGFLGDVLGGWISKLYNAFHGLWGAFKKEHPVWAKILEAVNPIVGLLVAIKDIANWIRIHFLKEREVDENGVEKRSAWNKFTDALPWSEANKNKLKLENQRAYERNNSKLEDLKKNKSKYEEKYKQEFAKSKMLGSPDDYVTKYGAAGYTRYSEDYKKYLQSDEATKYATDKYNSEIENLTKTNKTLANDVNNATFGAIPLAANMKGKSFGGGIITSGIGYRDLSIKGSSKAHRGIDLNYGMGQKVNAFEGGTVVKVGTERGYGKVVVVKNTVDGKDFFSRYAHLSDNSMVAVGQQIKAGQLIGKAGNTGLDGMAPHLHYEKRMKNMFSDFIVNPLTNEIYDFNKKSVAKGAEKIVSSENTKTETQSLQLASNGLRTALNERTGGGKPGDTENQRLERTRRMIFSATDVTGSMGVWGITHLNNHGGMYVGGKGGR